MLLEQLIMATSGEVDFSILGNVDFIFFHFLSFSVSLGPSFNLASFGDKIFGVG